MSETRGLRRKHVAVFRNCRDAVGGAAVWGEVEVGLKDILGRSPRYVWWWWDAGQKDEAVRKRVVKGKEGRGFDVPVVDGYRGSKQIRMEMAEGPILIVEE